MLLTLCGLHFLFSIKPLKSQQGLANPHRKISGHFAPLCPVVRSRTRWKKCYSSREIDDEISQNCKLHNTLHFLWKDDIKSMYVSKATKSQEYKILDLIAFHPQTKSKARRNNKNKIVSTHLIQDLVTCLVSFSFTYIQFNSLSSKWLNMYGKETSGCQIVRIL